MESRKEVIYYDTGCGWYYTEEFFRSAYGETFDEDERKAYTFDEYMHDTLEANPYIVPTNDTYADALEKLPPVVVPLDRLREHLKLNRFIWVEFIDPEYESDAYIGSICRFNAMQIGDDITKLPLATPFDIITCDFEYYNKTWRVWSKPFEVGSKQYASQAWNK